MGDSVAEMSDDEWANYCRVWHWVYKLWLVGVGVAGVRVAIQLAR